MVGAKRGHVRDRSLFGVAMVRGGHGRGAGHGRGHDRHVIV